MSDPANDPRPGSPVSGNESRRDPTRITQQPALTTSSGRSWLVLGGLLALIALVVLVLSIALPPAGLAFGAAIVVFALYAMMIIVQLVVRPPRRRLVLLAVCMLAMAAVAFGAILVIAWTAAGAASA